MSSLIWLSLANDVIPCTNRNFCSYKASKKEITEYWEQEPYKISQIALNDCQEHEAKVSIARWNKFQKHPKI